MTLHYVVVGRKRILCLSAENRKAALENLHFGRNTERTERHPYCRKQPFLQKAYISAERGHICRKNIAKLEHELNTIFQSPHLCIDRYLDMDVNVMWFVSWTVSSIILDNHLGNEILKIKTLPPKDDISAERQPFCRRTERARNDKNAFCRISAENFGRNSVENPFRPTTSLISQVVQYNCPWQ